MLVHEVWHDRIQRALPLTRSPGARARVRPKFAKLFVVSFLGMRQCYLAARGGIFTREQYGVGHFFHRQIPNGAQGPSAGRTTGELGATVATNKMAALALEDRWQHIVKTDGTLKEAGQVIVGGGGARQGRYPLGRCTLGGTCRKCCGSLTTHFCKKQTNKRKVSSFSLATIISQTFILLWEKDQRQQWADPQSATISHNGF